MTIIVGNDRKCSDGLRPTVGHRASRLARFSCLSGFDRETGNGAIVLTNLDFFTRLEFGNEFAKMKLGFGSGDLGHDG